MRVKLAALAVVIGCAVSGCGSPAPVQRAIPSPGSGCPQAADHHGYMGECAPRTFKLAPGPVTTPNGVRFEDRSNNNPCVCGSAIKAAGYSGLIVKANQGSGFIDPWAVRQVQSARAAGLAVGLYDFDYDYSISEADALLRVAHAAGIEPGSANTFPLTFDVEAGNFNYGGLLAQIAHVRAAGYRVQIYSGSWYWASPRICSWPAGVPAWLSGYPNASLACGLPASLFVEHQYTDSPEDLTVFLGSSDQFQQFVAAVPPKPVDVHHYSRYPTTRRKACGCSERAVVRSYDRLRAKQGRKHHPHRAELKTLRHDAGLLATRIQRVANRNSVGVWGVSPQWQVFHRRYRWRELLVRAHGGVADHAARRRA